MFKLKMKVIGKVVAACCLTLMSSTLFADSLFTAYNQALKYDATFAQARADYSASKESKLAAWSAFIPQLSTSGNLISNYDKDITNDFSINAQQVIFNWAAFRQISQANAQVRQAVLNLSYAEQDLMRRCSSAYFNVVKYEELMRVTKGQLASMRRQLAASHERFKVGHSTITDIERVRATYDLYRSQLIGIRMQLNNAREALYEITGNKNLRVPYMNTDFRLMKPYPLSLQVWQDRVKKDNLGIKAAMEGVEVAKAAVGVQRGSYLPTVNAVGTYYPEKISGLDKHFIYGLSLSYSAFQGGNTFAQVGRAQAYYQKSMAQRDAAFRNAMMLMETSYTGMLEGVAQLKAEKLAVKSNKSALKHTEEGYIAGNQTVLDVLDQQNKLFEALKTYINSRVNYLNNVIMLEQSAGSLSPTVLQQMQKWLK